jgi:putative SOS response-associated peptidase YedK
MCCRYTLAEIELLTALCEALELPPPNLARKRRYNVAPSQQMPVALRDGAVTWSELAFGFKAELGGAGATSLLPNARAETILEKRAFRDAVRQRRCLVPADGFYEWERDGRSRQPHYFQLKGGRPFFFAGIWQPPSASGPGGFAIVTTAPNTLLSRIHDRMPVILPDEKVHDWLGEDPLPEAKLRSLFTPCPDESMTTHPVGRAVNNARYEAPDCIARAEIDPELPLRFT